jgi:hypothetical protein
VYVCSPLRKGWAVRLWWTGCYIHSGQEAFVRKAKESPVAEALVVSTADVTSTASGAGVTAASEADKVGTSTAPTTTEEGGDC